MRETLSFWSQVVKLGFCKGKWLTSQLGCRSCMGTHAAWVPTGAGGGSSLRIVGSGVGSPGQWTDAQDILFLMHFPYTLVTSKAPKHLPPPPCTYFCSLLCKGSVVSRQGLPQLHPFSTDRHQCRLNSSVSTHCPAVPASRHPAPRPNMHTHSRADSYFLPQSHSPASPCPGPPV